MHLPGRRALGVLMLAITGTVVVIATRAQADMVDDCAQFADVPQKYAGYYGGKSNGAYNREMCSALEQCLREGCLQF